METVEDFVVRVMADFRLFVYETVVDILIGDEARQRAALLFKYGAEPVCLRLLFTVDQHFVAALHLGADIRCEEFEVLVEYRLRGNAELNCVRFFTVYGDFQIDPSELCREREKFPLLIHI